jgi:transcriptional regulator with XRE-family HTH domain
MLASTIGLFFSRFLPIEKKADLLFIAQVGYVRNMVALMPPRTGFASRLRAIRDAAGLTQVVLAERAGLSLGTLLKLENGQREPHWSSVVALAKALGCKTDDFLLQQGSEVMPPRQRGRPRRPSAEEAPAKRPAPPKRGRGKGRR